MSAACSDTTSACRRRSSTPSTPAQLRLQVRFDGSGSRRARACRSCAPAAPPPPRWPPGRPGRGSSPSARGRRPPAGGPPATALPLQATLLGQPPRHGQHEGEGVVGHGVTLSPGVWHTGMPRAVAAARSMWSTPVPMVLITRNRGAAARNSASTWSSGQTSTPPTSPSSRSTSPRRMGDESVQATLPTMASNAPQTDSGK